MDHSRIGAGTVLLIIIIACARGYQAYQRHTDSMPDRDTPQFDPQEYAKRQQESMQRKMEQQQQHLNNMRERTRQQTQSIFDQQRQASQQRMQEQLERNRQIQAEHQRRMEERMRQPPPAYRPTVSIPERPTVTIPSRPSPHRPQTTSPKYSPSNQPATGQRQDRDRQAAKPEVEPIALSPEPDQALLEKYDTWQADGSYSRHLGESFEFGDWRFKPSREFKLQRTNSRTAKWGVGKAGIGLDADLFKLYPRDHGMACPVHEDTETRQVFRLGRREIRARGNAEVCHLKSNGLVIWRIHVPAGTGDRFGSCYYFTVLGEKDALLFTCRYEAEKPEQIAAFDAVVQTLEYVKPGS
ncbi:MAG: hypothetical protein AAGC72_03630 [Planctomycetota bacterium]